MWTTAFSFPRLRAQFIKEVLSVLRDPRSRMVVFVPPILQLLVFAFAATLEVRNVASISPSTTRTRAAGRTSWCSGWKVPSSLPMCGASTTGSSCTS